MSCEIANALSINWETLGPSLTWMGRMSFFFIEHFLQGDGVYTLSLFKVDGVYEPSLLLDA